MGHVFSVVVQFSLESARNRNGIPVSLFLRSFEDDESEDGDEEEDEDDLSLEDESESEEVSEVKDKPVARPRPSPRQTVPVTIPRADVVSNGNAQVCSV